MLTIMAIDWCTLIVGRHKARPLQPLQFLYASVNVIHFNVMIIINCIFIPTTRIQCYISLYKLELSAIENYNIPITPLP